MNYNKWNKSELIERISYLESELNRRWNEEQYLSFIYDSLDSTLNGVIITDLDGIIRYVNHSFLYIIKRIVIILLISKKELEVQSNSQAQKRKDRMVC